MKRPATRPDSGVGRCSLLAYLFEEIPKDQPVVVHCSVGYRSYIAQQILRQHGWTNVRNLYGGFAFASEVQGLGEREGPQEITLHGRSVAVVLSRAEYDRLAGTGESLVDFMRRSPLYGQEDIDFPRDKSLTREVAI